MTQTRPRWALMSALVDLRPHVGKPCPYCGATMTRAFLHGRQVDRGTTREHIVPTSRGGSDMPHNLLVVCRSCNDLKGDLLLTEWFELLRSDGDPRADRVVAILDGVRALRLRCEAIEARERVAVEARA